MPYCCSVETNLGPAPAPFCSRNQAMPRSRSGTKVDFGAVSLIFPQWPMTDTTIPAMMAPPPVPSEKLVPPPSGTSTAPIRAPSAIATQTTNTPGPSTVRREVSLSLLETGGSGSFAFSASISAFKSFGTNCTNMTTEIMPKT